MKPEQRITDRARRRVVVAAMIVAALAGVAVGGSPPAAPSATTVPSTNPAAADTPEAAAVRAAAVAAVNAARGDDLEAVKATHTAVDAFFTEWQLGRAVDVETRRFARAVADRFGDPGKAYAEGQERHLRRGGEWQAEFVGRARVDITGDEARLVDPRFPRLARVRMKKVDGAWKQVGVFLGPPEEPPEIDFRRLREFAAAVGRLSADVRDGRFKSVDDAAVAWTALDERYDPPALIGVGSGPPGPATRPAGKP